MLDSFYNIRNLELWLKPENGLVCHNDHAFVSLNVIPSSFGHSLVIPKRKVLKATELSPEELHYLHRAKEEGLIQLSYLINNNPDHIIKVYGSWANDETLNSSLPCRERIERVMDDLNEGQFSGEANVFENIGESAGQTVAHYHMQIVPRFRKDLRGCGEALFKYLHE